MRNRGAVAAADRNQVPAPGTSTRFSMVSTLITGKLTPQ